MIPATEELQARIDRLEASLSATANVLHAVIWNLQQFEPNSKAATEGTEALEDAMCTLLGDRE